MGRGRAKAKQTKVARDLKYRTFDTDLGALERELKERQGEGSGNGQEPSKNDEAVDADDTDEHDPYVAEAGDGYDDDRHGPGS